MIIVGYNLSKNNKNEVITSVKEDLLFKLSASLSIYTLHITHLNRIHIFFILLMRLVHSCD